MISLNGNAVASSVTGCLNGAGLFVLSAALFVLTADKKELRKSNTGCMKRNILPFLAVATVTASLGVVYSRVGALKNVNKAFFIVYPVICFTFLFLFHSILVGLGRSIKINEIDYYKSFAGPYSGLMFEDSETDKEFRTDLSGHPYINRVRRVATYVLLLPITLFCAMTSFLAGLVSIMRAVLYLAVDKIQHAAKAGIHHKNSYVHKNYEHYSSLRSMLVWDGYVKKPFMDMAAYVLFPIIGLNAKSILCGERMFYVETPDGQYSIAHDAMLYGENMIECYRRSLRSTSDLQNNKFAKTRYSKSGDRYNSVLRCRDDAISNPGTPDTEDANVNESTTKLRRSKSDTRYNSVQNTPSTDMAINAVGTPDAVVGDVIGGRGPPLQL